MRIVAVLLLAVLCSFSCLAFAQEPAPVPTIGSVTIIPSFAPDYIVLDSIPAGSLGTTWHTEDFGGTYIVSSHSETVSPYDNSTALMQYYMALHGYTSMYRNFQLGKECLPGSKIAFFLMLHLADEGALSAEIVVSFFKGQNEISRLSCGYGATWPVPTGQFNLVLQKNHAGLIEFDTSSFSSSFDNITITVKNYSFSGMSGSVIDEVRYLPVSETSDLKFSVSAPYLLIGKDDQTSGLVLTAKTSTPQTIKFKVGESLLASVPTVPKNGEHVAEMIWWGEDSSKRLLPDGVHTIFASVGDKFESKNITVQRIPSLMIAFALPPSGFAKDPTSALLPTRPSCYNCVADFSDVMGKTQPGYVSSVLIGDPVNIVSGNYSLPKIDLRLKSRIPLVLSRVYNSLDTNSGPFGRGWSSLYFTRLENTSATPTLKLSDGSKIPFTKQGKVFVSDSMRGLSLSYSNDTTFWTLTNPQSSEWTFDKQGKIIRMANSCCGKGSSDAIVFEYDTKGFLNKVTNPEGRYFKIITNSQGRITSVTDSANRTVSYKYDNNGRLIFSTDPINRATSYSYDDAGFLTNVTVPGSRSVSITYENLRASKITFPDGTSSTFEWNFENKSATLTDPKGIKRVYKFDESWNMQNYSVPNTGMEKEFELTGSFVTGFKNPTGTKRDYEYNENGLLKSITDSLGNTWRYEYHPKFRKLTKEIDPIGREWSYSWCPKGNLTSITNPLGAKISYKYDQWNNLISITDPLGRVSKDEYDKNGNRILRRVDAMNAVASFTYDSRGNLLSITDPLSRKIRFEYDLLDRLTKTIYPDGSFVQDIFNIEGQIEARVDNFGRRTEFTYDLNGRLVSKKDPDGSVVSREYDEDGRLISDTDPLGQVIKYNYNDIGALVSVEYPDSSVESFEYDSAGRLTTAQDEIGAQMKFEYDSEGRPTAIIDPLENRWESTYDAVGRVITAKTPKNQLLAYTYDSLSRVVKVVYPDGTKVLNEFDAVGNLLKTTDQQGATWSWRYDNLNRLIKTIRPDNASATIVYDSASQIISATDPLGRTVKNAYDTAGRLSMLTDSLGNTWKNGYDSLGRLTSNTDPLGAVSTIEYDSMDRIIKSHNALGNTSSFEYDLAGRTIATIDPLGKRSVYSYDFRNRLSAFSDPQARTISHGYDLAGRQVSLTEGFGRVWRWDYDLLDRKISEITPLGDSSAFSYDQVGNRISLTNARGNTTECKFDLMNRLSSIRYPNLLTATFSYDLLGRELSRSSIFGSVTKTWSPIGNLLCEKFGPWDKSWKYEYDLVGNRIKAISPEGETFKYAYDKANRLYKLNWSSCKDDLTYAYDKVGRLIETNRPGIISKYCYDKIGNLLSLSHTKGKTILSSRKYMYDRANRCVVMTDEEKNTTSYTYDDAGWLKSVFYPDKVKVSYEYNSAGDRIKETTKNTTVQYSYDAAGRMIKRGKDTFEYDDDGNLVKSVENGLETRLYWSSDNQLLKVEREIPCKKHYHMGCSHCKKTYEIIEEYSYLPQDWRRVTRTTQGKTFVSVYDGEDESHEYLVTPKGKDWRFGRFCWNPKLPKLHLYREFISGPGIDDIEAVRYFGRDLWSLKDGLGSTIAIVNRGGRLIAKIAYDAWGAFRWPDKKGHHTPPCHENDLYNLLERFDFGRTFGCAMHDHWHYGRHFAQALTPYLYAGRRYSAATGMYFNRNRYYNPSFGRFTSKDPIGFAGSSNLWSYAANNPTNFIDPYGYMTTDQLNAYQNTLGLNANAFNQTMGMNLNAYNSTMDSFNPQNSSLSLAEATNVNTALFWNTIKLSTERFLDTVKQNNQQYWNTVKPNVPLLSHALSRAPDFWPSPLVDMSFPIEECQPRKRRVKKLLLASSDLEFVQGHPEEPPELPGENIGSEFERDPAWDAGVPLNPTNKALNLDQWFQVLVIYSALEVGFGPLGGRATVKGMLTEGQGGRGLGNPFKGKTSEQIDEMFKAKGFEPRGPDPKNGFGGYVDPKTGRSYHIDPKNSFNEPPHVDVNRPKTYDGPLEKKKYFTGE